ncbi:ATP-binding protein [Lentzea sp. NBRC 105346]|uniref:ATP-binding protein n=1 Tax=Lentzea sp. NBRC 105346 TaxID=3032205 RepID=UPI0024A21C3A|nr:ATP-binding protein [Lentzea sp. NBRC 105346]GLZ28767.1 ATP-binding protein [Lentzea sp. NBRC 105346]
MDYVGSRFPDYGPPGRDLTSAKVVVAGGFGVGKSTFIRSIVEGDLLTCAALPPERAGAVTKLVRIEFGRLWLDPGLALHLFVAPQWQTPQAGWNDVVRGAVGAVVLLDIMRPADSVDAIRYFEDHKIPYVIALNNLHAHPRGDVAGVLHAMGIDPIVPIVNCDPRYRHLVRQTLIALAEHAKLDRWRREPGPGDTTPLAPVC